MVTITIKTKTPIIWNYSKDKINNLLQTQSNLIRTMEAKEIKIIIVQELTNNKGLNSKVKMYIKRSKTIILIADSN